MRASSDRVWLVSGLSTDHVGLCDFLNQYHIIYIALCLLPARRCRLSKAHGYLGSIHEFYDCATLII